MCKVDNDAYSVILAGFRDGYCFCEVCYRFVYKKIMLHAENEIQKNIPNYTLRNETCSQHFLGTDNVLKIQLKFHCPQLVQHDTFTKKVLSCISKLDSHHL